MSNYTDADSLGALPLWVQICPIMIRVPYKEAFELNKVSTILLEYGAEMPTYKNIYMNILIYTPEIWFHIA